MPDFSPSLAAPTRDSPVDAIMESPDTIAGLPVALIPLREEFLANLVMLGQIPAPTGDEADRVRFVLDRPGVFLNTSSDARLLRPTLEAAATPAVPPTTAELAADQLAHGVRPLFDGAELDRI